MRLNPCIFASLALLTACSESGPARPRVTRIESIRSEIVLGSIALSYTGSQLTRMERNFGDGENRVTQTAELTYDGGRISQYVTKNSRGEQQDKIDYTYSDGLLTRLVATEQDDNESLSLAFNWADGLMTRADITISNGDNSATGMVAFTYNDQDRWTQIVNTGVDNDSDTTTFAWNGDLLVGIQDDDGTTATYEYNGDGQVVKATTVRTGQPTVVSTLAYVDGLISEITNTTQGEPEFEEVVKYSYESGQIEGVFFHPDIRDGAAFDLAGRPSDGPDQQAAWIILLSGDL